MKNLTELTELTKIKDLYMQIVFKRVHTEYFWEVRVSGGETGEVTKTLARSLEDAAEFALPSVRVAYGRKSNE